MTAIHGDRVRLRPIGPADRARAHEILATPEVARWWGEPEQAIRAPARHLARRAVDGSAGRGAEL